MRARTDASADSLVENEGSIRAHRALGFAQIETQVCFLKML
jgi:hypothetical protein